MTFRTKLLHRAEELTKNDEKTKMSQEPETQYFSFIVLYLCIVALQ